MERAHNVCMYICIYTYGGLQKKKLDAFFKGMIHVYLFVYVSI